MDGDIVEPNATASSCVCPKSLLQDLVPIKTDGLSRVFEIAGIEWEGWLLELGDCLTYGGRMKEGLSFVLSRCEGDGQNTYRLRMSQDIGFGHSVDRSDFFPTLESAAAAAKVAKFETRLVERFTWYSDDQGVWTTAFGEGDKGKVFELEGAWTYRRLVYDQAIGPDSNSHGGRSFETAAYLCADVVRALRLAADEARYQEGFQAGRASLKRQIRRLK